MGYSWSVVTHLGTRLLVPSGGVLFEPMAYHLFRPNPLPPPPRVSCAIRSSS